MNAPVVQLGTRIPERLRRALRVYCVESEVSVEDFVAQALAERLERVASADAHSGRAGRARQHRPRAWEGTTTWRTRSRVRSWRHSGRLLGYRPR